MMWRTFDAAQVGFRKRVGEKTALRVKPDLKFVKMFKISSRYCDDYLKCIILKRLDVPFNQDARAED